MPSLNEIQKEISFQSYHDFVRRKYLTKYNKLIHRNVILYYSGWLQKPSIPNRKSLGIDDNDKMGFMATIKGMDKSKGLDLILHTPGGEVAATESLVDYLQSVFGKNIRAIIPQLALSAGTMLALSTKEIIMGKHSSLGPIDPHIGGIPTQGVLEEFETAKQDIITNPNLAHAWGPILSKYNPTFIGECQKAIKWAEEMITKWLKDNMFADDANKNELVEKIVEQLGRHGITKAHNRHIPIDQLRDMGLKVTRLEENDQIQDLVLSIHHSTILTISDSTAYKIIENQKGEVFFSHHG